VSYVFQFDFVWRDFDQLLLGAWLTIKLSAGAMFFGLIVGIACAQAKNSRWPALRAVVQVYVEAIRNTPFLVQLLLIYLGLPSIGIRLLPSEAALLAMVVNVGAYATEIVRAGIESVPREHIEAGRALGLKPWQIFRFIVVIPALRAVFPALGSQFILVMLASSVVSVISAEELTAVTDMIVARNFRSFEFYLVATGMYLAMSFGFQAVFALIDRWLFSPWSEQA
jgi:polar amino acid transport system permease protein